MSRKSPLALNLLRIFFFSGKNVELCHMTFKNLLRQHIAWLILLARLTLIEWSMLKQPCISEINITSS